MASEQKKRLLYLREYLLKYTDEEHALSRIEIEQVLAEKGFEFGRKLSMMILMLLKRAEWIFLVQNLIQLNIMSEIESFSCLSLNY